MAKPVEVTPPDYLAIAAAVPPLPIPPGPVHAAGTSPVDAVMAAFGAATNADLPEMNALLAEDHSDRIGHAMDAARKFTTYEDDAGAQFEDLAGRGASGGEAMQGFGAALQGATGALSGVLGSVGRLPQELMQAGQGVLSPLLSAAQSLGDGGLGDAAPASDFVPDPPGGDVGFAGAAGPGMGTTPAGNLGPPPVPGTSTPTTPAGSTTYTGAAGPSGGAPAAGGAGGPMMPMVPGGAGAGGKTDAGTGAKRIASPGIPNGQPVKGRTTIPPNVPVTRSVARNPGQPAITPLKRIAGKDDSST